MNYLELCRSTLDAADTSDGTVFTSVQDAFREDGDGTSKLYMRQVANHVREAWARIQLLHDDWEFRKGGLSFNLANGQAEYNAGSLSYDGRLAYSKNGLDRFLFPSGRPWTHSLNGGAPRALRFGGAPVDREGFGIVQAPGSPVSVSVDSWGKLPGLRFDPVPGPGEHVVRGYYLKSAQLFRDDNDVPDILEQFHDLIKWKAVIMLHGTDESADSYSFAVGQYRELMDSFNRRYRPAPAVGKPLE